MYNTEKYLPDCLESLLAQTHENLEIILVDDGSSDSSGAICDEYAARDSRVKVIHKENAGVSAARNSALDAATGDFIGFVDSDDLVKRDMYEILCKNALESGSDIAICRLARFFDSEDKENVLAPDSGDCSLLELDTRNALADLLIGKHFYGSLCDKLFSARVVNNIRLNKDIFVAEDFLFTVEALANAKRVCFCDRVLYRYRMRESSATHLNYSEKHLTSYDACVAAENILRSRGLYGELKDCFDASAVVCHVKIMRGLCESKELRKKYARRSVKELRRHFNRRSSALLNPSVKKHAIIIRLSGALYFAVQKLLGGK